MIHPGAKFLSICVEGEDTERMRQKKKRRNKDGKISKFIEKKN